MNGYQTAAYAALALALLLVAIVLGRKPPRNGTRGLALVLALLLPGLAAAQTPMPAPGSVSFEVRAFVGSLTKADGQEEPIAGLRTTFDVETVAGLHVVLRADLMRLSDGAAVDANLEKVPAFRSGEFIAALYRPVAGPLAIECAVGVAVSFERADISRTSPRLWACGAGYHAGELRVFGGVGAYEATGTGTRYLGSLTLPLRGKTALQVDGAAGGPGGPMVRTGLGVRW